ncbi:MAG: hypothetical protein KAZ88_02690 [Acidimicrobiia bacterium]|nr:hypothetical protein [Acidimicrobiia bacterium]
MRWKILVFACLAVFAAGCSELGNDAQGGARGSGSVTPVTLQAPPVVEPQALPTTQAEPATAPATAASPAPADQAPPQTAAPAAAAPAQGTPYACNPTRYTHCSLPWPTDLATIGDPGSPTGKRVFIADQVIGDAARAPLPADLLPSDIYNGASGFSPNGPVQFELPERFSGDTPSDGANAIIAIDTTTGTRVPIRVEADRNVSVTTADPDDIIRVFPQNRFQFGHHIVVVVTNSLKTSRGGDFSRAIGLKETLADNNPANTHAAHVREQMASLPQYGVDPDTVLQITDFTVRDQQEIVNPLVKMIQQVSNLDHPIRNVQNMGRFPGDASAVFVRGEVLMQQFRTSTGYVDPNMTPYDQWVVFDMVIPRASADGPRPVAIYGHGLTLAKEGMIPWVREMVDQGIAIVSFDLPNHSTRAVADGGIISKLTYPDSINAPELNTPEQAARVAGQMIQANVDLASMTAAVRQHFGEFDFWGPNNSADGVPDLNGSLIYYHGLSLGAVEGVAYAAATPGVKGAIIEAGGVGFIDMVTKSVLFEIFKFQNLVPKAASGADAAFLLATLQQAVDMADGANYAEWFRNPPAGLGLSPTPVLNIYTINDGAAYFEASERLSRLANLPLVGKTFRDVPGLAADPSGAPDGFRTAHFSQITPSWLYYEARVGINHLGFLAPEIMGEKNRFREELFAGRFGG